MQESLFDAMEDHQQKSRKVMEQVNFSTLSVPKQTKAFIEYL